MAVNKELSNLKPEEGKKPIEKVKALLPELTDEERENLFSDYCKHCGRYDADKPRGCQCWNDE